MRKNLKSSNKEIQSLLNFRRNGEQSTQIYLNAFSVPLFLTKNLLSSHRVIKQFTGQDAILRAFYFNLMKLAFQLQNDEVNYIQLVEQTLIGYKEFGVDELSDKYFSDKQYRTFLKQFFELLQDQQVPRFEETIQQFPIVDEILRKMFKQLVPNTLQLRDGQDHKVARRIFEYLSKKFKINMQAVSGCFKFVESDIFIYLSSLNKVYLIFMDQLTLIRQVTQEENSQNLSFSNKQDVSRHHSFHSAQNLLSKAEQIKQKEFRQDNISCKKFLSDEIDVLDGKSCDSARLSSSIRERINIEEKIGHQLYFKSSKDSAGILSKQNSSAFENYEIFLSRNLRSSQITSLNTLKNKKLMPNKQQTLPQQMNNQNRQILKYKSLDNPKLTGFYDSLINLDQNNYDQKKADKKLARYYEEKKVKCLKLIEKQANQQGQKTQQNEDKAKQMQIYKISQDQNKSPNTQFKSIEESYEKFTDSALLQLLDEQYRAKIKLIKQKYRQLRTKIQPSI